MKSMYKTVDFFCAHIKQGSLKLNSLHQGKMTFIVFCETY